MATWSTKSALLGSSESDSLTSCLSSPSSPPITPTTTTSLPSTPSPTLDDCMDDSGFQDWMEMQLGVTGEMTVVERLQHLLDTGQFADINIRVGQGNNATLFKAHRLLLATASQPLYRLVQQGTPGPGASDMATLRITDMKPADFESILKYIYTDRVECENINVAFGLLRASRKWGLAGLGIKSLTYLEEFVDSFEPNTDEAKDNLFDLLMLSEDTLTELSGKCYQIILKHAETLIPSRGYLNLDKPMVQKVLCHPDMKMQDQLKLFEAVRDWGLSYIQQNKLPISALGNAVEEIIKVVDFEKIKDSDFLSTVLTSECLGKAEVIAFFMTHGLEIPRKLDFNNNKQLPFWLTFCATTGRSQGAGPKGGGRNSKRSSVSSSSSPSSLAPVSEGLTSICSLTQNGSVMEFNKACRFKKGYRCTPNEIYMQHELRFRVDKNVKLLGVSFGFLFTPTDMGLNLHCQGPWETRQWTDIIQSYVRVSGEKQETADVRLMFLNPVRIEANQSYKVMVKMVRMSHGSNEVELWGGTGGVHCVETEDAEFCFIKAAVDPDKPVEESDGDTTSGAITALLYRLDTDEPEPTPEPIRRRRPVQPEEEVTSPTSVQTSNPWRTRTRPDTLRIPDTPYSRKRSPATDDVNPYQAPVRRRERPPSEDYVPSTFSTNRWRIKPKEEKEEKPSTDDYLPSSFSTNRWSRPRPKEDTITDTSKTLTERKKSTTDEYLPSSFSTNRWSRPRPKEDATDTTNTHTERKTSAPEYRPSSFSTNRWSKPSEDKTERKSSAPEQSTSSSSSSSTTSTSLTSSRLRSRPKEEESSTDTSRKTSTEENKWRTRPQDTTKDTPFGMRVRPTRTVEEAPSSHPFARRRESRDTGSDIPFYLRKTDDIKPPVATLGRSRWGTSSTTTTTAASSTPSSTSTSSSKPSGDTTFHSRFLRSSGSSSSPYTSSRFGSVRESSLTRSSLPRSTAGTYLSRYDSTADSSSSRASTSSRPATGEGQASSAPAARKSLRYGTAATSSGSNLLALSNSSFGSGIGGSSARASLQRDGNTNTGSNGVDRYSGSSSSTSRYGTTSTPGSTSSSRYGTTTASRYGSTGSGTTLYGGTSGVSSTTSHSNLARPYGATTSSGTSGRYTSSSGTDTLGGTSRYSASRASLGSGRYTSGGKYGSSASGDVSASRSSGMRGYSRTSSGGSGQGSRYGYSGSSSRYSSPAPAASLGR